jgi:HEPN domain-containing protein
MIHKDSYSHIHAELFHVHQGSEYALKGTLAYESSKYGWWTSEVAKNLSPLRDDEKIDRRVRNRVLPARARSEIIGSP